MRGLVLSLLLIFLLIPLAAQFPGWTNYLSGGGTYSVCGTSTDIWVGSKGKLAKYDLTDLEPEFYTHASSGLPYNDLYYVAADSLGNIWCAYPYRGLSKYDGSTWTHYTVPGMGVIVSLAVQGPNDVWLGTEIDGLYHFDGSAFTQHNGYQAGPRSGGISLTVDRQGRLWFQEINVYDELIPGTQQVYGSVYCYDGIAFTPVNPQVCPYDITPWCVASIKFDANNQPWYATHGGWLWHFDGTAWTNYTYANSGLTSEYIFDIVFDMQDNLWVWQTTGFCRFDGVNWQDFPELDGYYSEAGTLYVDQENTLWFGGQDLHRYAGGELITLPVSNSGLSSGNVKKSAIDPNGTVWFGTYKGLDWFDGQAWGHVDLPGAEDDISDLGFDSWGRLWIATTRNGLICYDDGVLTAWNTDNSGIATNYLDHLEIDTQDRVWVGYWGGIESFDGNLWTNHSLTGAPFPTGRVSALAADSSNRIWVGLYQTPTGPGALAVLEDGVWTVYDASNSVLDNFRTNAIHVRDGIAWIATEGGLARFDGANWELWTTQNSGLPNDRVRDIAFDSYGHMFCSTASGGLAHYDGNWWTNWTSNNSGLPDNYPRSLLIAPGNQVWICNTSNGVTVFDHGATPSLDPVYVPASQVLRTCPNPFSDRISFDGWSERGEIRIALFNLRGQKLAQWDLPAGRELTLDLADRGLADLPAGIYLWRLSSETGSAWCRSVKCE